MASTKPSNESTANKGMKEDRETVVRPTGESGPAGIGHRDNGDGTTTWYPKTTVGFFQPEHHEKLKQSLTPSEYKLLEKNLIKGIAMEKDKWITPATTPEWKESLDLYYSIKQSSEKEFLFVATRHFDKAEPVAVTHLSLGQKSTLVRERKPATVSVHRDVTVDVFRGKSQHALRQTLKAVEEFFGDWAAFQIRMDKAENTGLGSVSRERHLRCNYTLRLPVAAPHDDLASQLSKKIEECTEAWFRPTAEMCASWGYETKDNKRGRSEDSETVVVVCRKH